MQFTANLLYLQDYYAIITKQKRLPRPIALLPVFRACIIDHTEIGEEMLQAWVLI